MYLSTHYLICTPSLLGNQEPAQQVNWLTGLVAFWSDIVKVWAASKRFCACLLFHSSHMSQDLPPIPEAYALSVTCLSC